MRKTQYELDCEAFEAALGRAVKVHETREGQKPKAERERFWLDGRDRRHVWKGQWK